MKIMLKASVKNVWSMAFAVFILNVLLLSTVQAFPVEGAIPSDKDFHIVSKKVGTFTAVLTESHIPEDIRNGDLEVFALQPPELSSQRNVEISVSAKVDNKEESDDQIVSPKSSTVAYQGIEIRLKSKMNGKRIDVESTFKGDLIEVSVESGPPTEVVPALAVADRRRHLASSALMDFKDSTFRKLLLTNQLTRKPDEGVLQFGHRVNSFIEKNYTHEPHAPAAPSRKPADTLAVRKSDCGGFALLFVAIMRANDIPARSLWGRWAVTQDDPEYGGWHVIPEFYVDGAGWIRALDNSFGKHSGNFITFHIDTDLQLTREVKRIWSQTLIWHWDSPGKIVPATQKPHWWSVEINAGE